nr:adenylate/guanylate cyclase domain-containing protein [Motiliproteus sediminis]
MQSLLNTYLGPRSAQRVRAGQVKRGDSECLQAVVWYSDLRESTALAEALPEAQLLALLNEYFALISDAVTPRGGEILRFVGDALLVIFPIGAERSATQAARDAVAAVGAAECARQRLNHKWQQQGIAEIRYGIGLELGELVYGNVGAPQRLDFTVMGAAVNHAARIETLTKACQLPVLLSDRLAALLPQGCRLVGQFPVPGVERPLTLYTLNRGSSDEG